MSTDPEPASRLQCAICLERLKGPVETNCGHAFCSPCLVEYLRTRSECPLCRQHILSAHPSFTLRELCPPANLAEVDSQRAADAELSSMLPQHGGQTVRPRPRGFIARLKRDWNDLVRMLRDPQQPNLVAWAFIIFVVLYVISPWDLIPDYIIPGLALIDDIIIIGWAWFALNAIVQRYNTRQR